MAAMNDNVIDIDKIGVDPEEDAKLLRMLKNQALLKNIIQIDEFRQKYERLFQHVSDMDATEMRTLSSEYMYRIDPYNPVYIVEDAHGESVEHILRSENIILILPAIYNRIGTVNELPDDVGLDKMLQFNNLVVMDIQDPFDKKKVRYTQELAAVFQAMTDPEKLQENRERAQAMAEQALEASRQQNIAPTQEEQEADDAIIAKYQEESAPEPTEHEEYL